MITRLELMKPSTLAKATALAKQWARELTNYHEIADVLGNLSASEMLHANHTFNDSPTAAMRGLAVDSVIAKWKWRVRRNLAIAAVADAKRVLIETARDAGLVVTEAEAFLQLQSFFCRHEE